MHRFEHHAHATARNQSHDEKTAHDIALKRIRTYCRENLDLESDSVRIYKICNRCISRVVISGRGLKVTQLDYAVV